MPALNDTEHADAASPHRRQQLDAIVKVLTDEGGVPGHDLHSWRCSYPEQFGPCTCLADVADLILGAIEPAVEIMEPVQPRTVEVVNGDDAPDDHTAATHLPDLSADEVREQAINAVRRFHGGRPFTGHADDATLNWLRHNYSDYDHDQSLANLMAVHSAIVARWPHLQAASGRQIENRRLRNRLFGEDSGRRAGMSPAQLESMREQRDRECREVLVGADYRAGQRVSFARNGQTFNGTIVHIGSVRVSVRVETPDGQMLSEPVYANEIHADPDADR